MNITDADREAANAWFKLCIAHNPNADPVSTLEQAFAAHRLRGYNAGLEPTLLNVATRAATAKPEETALFLEKLCWLDRGPSLLLDENRAWASDFAALLHINTPESLLAATMMLVPEGWLIVHLSELGAAGGCVCKLGNPETSEEAIADAGERTMALALIAAIAQSKGL